jgi:hypothetical protein
MMGKISYAAASAGKNKAAKKAVQKEARRAQANRDEESAVESEDEPQDQRVGEESEEAQPAVRTETVLMSFMQQMMEAQQKSQQQMMDAQMEKMEQLMRSQPHAAGSSMIPRPIAISVARAGRPEEDLGQEEIGARRTLFNPPASAGLVAAEDAAEVASGSAGRRKPELEKLALFQGEMDSEKLDAWLRRLMVHCSYYGSTGGSLEKEKDKVVYAAAHLEGAAADWWFSVMDGKVSTMQQFMEAVNGRFRSSVDADVAAEKLYRLKQTQGQPVAMYAGVVHQLLLRLPDMAMSDRVRQFARGLLPHLAQRVREMRPDTLEKATELAIRYEGSFGLPGEQTKGGAGGAGAARINTVTLGEEEKGPGGDEGKEGRVRQLELQLAAVQQWQKQQHGRPGGAVRPNSTPRSEGGRGYCYRCGEPGHVATKCSFTENVCYNCKEKGHTKWTCPKPPTGRAAPGAAKPGNG